MSCNCRKNNFQQIFVPKRKLHVTINQFKTGLKRQCMTAVIDLFVLPQQLISVPAAGSSVPVSLYPSSPVLLISSYSSFSSVIIVNCLIKLKPFHCRVVCTLSTIKRLRLQHLSSRCYIMTTTRICS